MQHIAKNNLIDIAKIRLGRFLGLADSVIRGALLQENYQVFLGLHFGFVASESDEEVTQEILGITKHPAQLRCNQLYVSQPSHTHSHCLTNSPLRSRSLTGCQEDFKNICLTSSLVHHIINV